ncbi:hypothetical protein GGTG_06827 [Gaeumannomyces tritici R3-111a-1]|uniref:Uncharacterized protein n=1 Tax=Gaeumannomyces tritici (strain R3-111a-1) TaxID=644352 RepID=J3NZY0_GAET3|nr:hypothetical protein GGTG_06827 [Gaeumannomyces tritici R3-111a-1]EJT76913.1 hypothetical protein GGTG_06827 [Gaeumannomyces tritici R3-111a-1]
MGLPGLVGQYQPQVISQAAKSMYMMGWQLTFVSSAAVVIPLGYDGIVPNTREFLAKEGREGFLDREREMASVAGSDELISPRTLAATDEKQVGNVEKALRV